MKSRTGTTYAVSAAAAATLALLGCSGGADEPTTPTSTSSPSASASATASSASPSASASATAGPTASPTASIDIPAAARTNTDAGAIAFVRFWFDQLNVAYTRPDAAVIPSNSTDECKSCATVQGDPVEYVAKGYRMNPEPIAGLSNLSIEDAPAGRTIVRFTVKQNAAKVTDNSGAVVDSQTAGTGTQLAVLVWKGDRWFMNGVADAS